MCENRAVHVNTPREGHAFFSLPIVSAPRLWTHASYNSGNVHFTFLAQVEHRGVKMGVWVGLNTGPSLVGQVVYLWLDPCADP